MIQALETERLGKRYGRKWALRNCALRIPIGHVTGLVGPNGAGKTTLLHMAVGLLAPTQGTIRVGGYEPRQFQAQFLQKIGFVAQDHPLIKSFPVRDLLTFGHKMNAKWDKAFALERLEQLK